MRPIWTNQGEACNPTFALTINQPTTVGAGEGHTLLVTLINVASTLANCASINLSLRSVAGAVRLSALMQTIETIPAGDAATVTLRLQPLTKNL